MKELRTLLSLCFLSTLIPLNSMAQTADDKAKSRRLQTCVHLFGDFGGLRPFLADHGVEVSLTYTSDFFANVSGGTEEHADYRADLSLEFTLDTEVAKCWDNGTFFIHLQAQLSDGITETSAGDLQVLSNIDADDFAQVSEFWYEHKLLDQKLRIKF